MKGATLLETLYSLGITPSRSRPRASNNNPYAESVFRTCKYRPQYPANGFADRTQAGNGRCVSFTGITPSTAVAD
ncbi:transposase [Paenibacillus tianmuensis]|uniref:transposase n=1 Tax=Paenibacillus tianmuensis TaxID=624147 RepID=UPI00115FCF2C|nr:transposase [Paenibacillus tianmuensis]